jgi:hypothetical protein
LLSGFTHFAAVDHEAIREHLLSVWHGGSGGEVERGVLMQQVAGIRRKTTQL